jgi:phosphoadenosine phosphosulfate reductase
MTDLKTDLKSEHRRLRDVTMTTLLEETSTLAESWEAEEVIRWACATYQPELAIASAFGAEGVVLIDIATRVSAQPRIFTLDTQFLFPETYELAGRIERRYDLKVEWLYSALSAEEQSEIYGPALWNDNPDQCCTLRKIEPLARKLAGLNAWITAIRRDQTTARANARKVEWDKRFGLVKINPLADWTSNRVWGYIRENRLEYNPLHDRSYPSIGCTHCTRPTIAGEPLRAGRWSGLQKVECGLHAPVPHESVLRAPVLHAPSAQEQNPLQTQLPSAPPASLRIK